MKNLNFDLIRQIRAQLNQDFPLGLIPRKKLGIITGGLLNPRTEANKDCLGQGIKDPVLVGRQVCYKTERVVEYFEGKISNKISKEAI